MPVKSDDGALNSDTLADACRTTCVLPSCGDAVTDTGESCDDAGESATCNADCSSSSCGDGIVNTTAGEECDDAANNSDTLADACRTSCLDASCGDSVVDTGEQCDPPDGGACSASCQDQAGCGDHLCSFTPAGGSNITLVSAILDLPLAANGSMNVNCDPNFPDTDGKCECAGEFVSVDQLTIPSIGIACLVPVPAAVCVNAGLLGNVDCDGGSDQDTSVTVDHNANISTSSAACTSHAECGAVCQPYCVGQGAIPSQALCGGYCQLSGASCVEDADCTGVGDTCVGPEFDATHTGECQCTCVELGDGNNDGPGDASLFAAFGLNVLTNAGQWGPDGIPCTLDDEPAITLPPQCAPFTTTSATTVVLNSGNSAGVTNPPGGPVTVTGAPFTCGGGVPTNASGTGIRAAASFLDSTLGDLSATITLNCE